MIADQNLTPLNPDEPGSEVGHAHVRDGKILDGRSVHARSEMKAMLRALDRGEAIDRDEFENNVRRAIEFRDDPNRADRVRLGCIQFLDGLIARGVNVAMHLDKIEREKAPVQAVVFVKVIKGVDEEAL